MLNDICYYCILNSVRLPFDVSNAINNDLESSEMRNERSLMLFESGIKTEATLKAYRGYMAHFIKFCKVSGYDSLVKLGSKKLQMLIEDYLIICKKKYRYGSIDNIFSAIQKFCVMNDMLEVNFKKIRMMFPEKDRPTGDRAYTTDDIKLLLDQTKTLKFKALIHLLASSGVRAGSVHEMQVKDLTDMPNDCKALKVYPGTKDEYTTFISPECVKALENYHNQRMVNGEKLDENSYLFMTDCGKKFILNYVSMTTSRLSKKLLNRKLDSSSRYTVMGTHGLRKRFNTIVKMQNNCNISLAERLLGHSRSVQLDNSYFRPTLEQLFTEYLKALPDLVIDQTLRLEQELENSKNEIKKFKNQEERILMLESQLQQFKGLSKQL